MKTIENGRTNAHPRTITRAPTHLGLECGHGACPRRSSCLHRLRSMSPGKSTSWWWDTSRQSPRRRPGHLKEDSQDSSRDTEGTSPGHRRDTSRDTDGHSRDAAGTPAGIRDTSGATAGTTVDQTRTPAGTLQRAPAPGKRAQLRTHVMHDTTRNMSSRLGDPSRTHSPNLRCDGGSEQETTLPPGRTIEPHMISMLYCFWAAPGLTPGCGATPP